MLAILPQAFPADAKDPLDEGAFRFVGQGALKVFGPPHVVRTLRAVAVRIHGGLKAPAWMVEVGHDPVGASQGGAMKGRVASLGPCLRHCDQQLRIVVQHLFKVWYMPSFVDAVAGKATAHVIVDAASLDASQRLECVLPTRVCQG